MKRSAAAFAFALTRAWTRLEQASTPRVAVWSVTAASRGVVCAMWLLVWSGDPGMPSPLAAPALSMEALMEAPPPPPPPPPLP